MDCVFADDLGAFRAFGCHAEEHLVGFTAVGKGEAMDDVVKVLHVFCPCCIGQDLEGLPVACLSEEIIEPLADSRKRLDFGNHGDQGFLGLGGGNRVFQEDDQSFFATPKVFLVSRFSKVGDDIANGKGATELGVGLQGGVAEMRIWAG